MGFESRGSHADLRANRVTESLGRLGARLARSSQTPEETAALLSDARAGLERLASEGATATLSESMQMGLEAIILADGSRPVGYVQDDRVVPSVDDLGERWAAAAATFRHGIAAAARSTGGIFAVTDSATAIGTGFAIAQGVIATNRHVLELIAIPDPAAPDGSGWRMADGIEIDFVGEFERPYRPLRRFPLERVLFAGPNEIGNRTDPAELDLAVIALEEVPGLDFPEAIPLADDVRDPNPGEPVHIIGFPARPAPGQERGRVLNKIFAGTYSYKRWAPGEVERIPGELPEDRTSAWCFSHDASTLSGNSGSCVLALSLDGRTAIGLHFGGKRRVENYAHAISRIRDVIFP